MAIFAGSTRRFSLALSPQNNPRLLYEGEAIKADGLNAIQASISKIGNRNNHSISLENAKAAGRLRPLSRLRGQAVKGSGTMGQQWDRNNGTGTMGQEQWDRNNGTGTMGQEQWDRS